MNTEVALPESAPVAVESKLTVYNGGVRKGVTTLFLYTFLRLPTPAAVVLRAKIKKIRRGRFGTESIVTVPAIAGGYGSITSFDVRIGRRFRIGKKEASVFTFTCPDGRLLARIESLFSNGSKGSITSVRSCWS